MQPSSHNCRQVLVVCAGLDRALLETRRLILEEAGHTVVTARDEVALITACSTQRIDVAVIGQTVASKMKLRISALIRAHCPSTKILELYQPHKGKFLKEADAWLAVPSDIPKDLADRVDELAASGRHFRRRGM